jgi:hypothetical protein
VQGGLTNPTLGRTVALASIIFACLACEGVTLVVQASSLQVHWVQVFGLRIPLVESQARRLHV